MSNTAELRAEIAADTELMFEARGWIADVTGDNTDFWSTALVLATIANQYSGGLIAFKANSAPEPAHVGHYSRLAGNWYCDTCDSPYCDLA